MVHTATFTVAELTRIYCITPPGSIYEVSQDAGQKPPLFTGISQSRYPKSSSLRHLHVHVMYELQLMPLGIYVSE